MAELIRKCTVCGSWIDEEDLFCANCGTEAPCESASAKAAADSASLVTDNFKCHGCGAAMSYDASAQALRCPFCGSLEMTPQGDHKVLTPRRVVPFRLKLAQAVAEMRAWLGRGFWRPSALAEQACVVKMTPVYVPYWVFQADTHTYWTADSSHTPPDAKGDWFPLSGEHQGSYAGLLIGASGALTAAETQAICPFDLTAGVAPQEVDLKNAIVEEFSRPKKYARPLAREGLETMETETCTKQYVPGKARNVHVNVQITGMTGEPVLLPVWIMAYRFRDRLFRFLVNGQTGRATGQAPLSWAKILIAIAIALLVILFLVFAVTSASSAVLGAIAVGEDLVHRHSSCRNWARPSWLRRISDILLFGKEFALFKRPDAKDVP